MKLQAWFKHNVKRQVRERSVLHTEESAFRDSPSLSNVSESWIETLVWKSYHMLLPKTIGPFRIVKVIKNAVTIDEHGVQNTVSIDETTQASSISGSTQHTSYRHSRNLTLPEIL